MVRSHKKKVVMSNLFLDIVNEKLELSDLDNENNKPVVFDINANFDGSVASMATFMVANGVKSFTTSSTLDFSDDYGIDPTMLDSFFDSVKTYEVI
mgnify:CR=1 FL=1